MQRLATLAAALTAGLALMAGPALAKEAVAVEIRDADGAIVVENGNFLAEGTHAIGTVKLWFMVEGLQFPTDDAEVQNFQMCLHLAPKKPKPATRYPATVDLYQVGTPEVILTPVPDSITFLSDDAETTDCDYPVDVGVTVPKVIADDPEFQADGTQLVANLQLSTAPKTHLDTVTTVKVILTLVHPVGACITPLHLVSNNGLDANLSDDGIDLTYHVGNDTLSRQQGQHLVALVNTCDDQVTLDLDTAINANFDPQSADAVQTTTANQEFADIPALLAFGLTGFTGVLPANSLCIGDIAVPGHQTFVVKEHVRLNELAFFPGPVAVSDAKDLGQWYYDGFTYAAHDVNLITPCTGAASVDVDPNVGEVIIPVNVVGYNGPMAPPDDFPACSDTVDNDTDGDTDLDDADCDNFYDDDESS